MATPTGATQIFRPHRVGDEVPERMRGIYADLVREWCRACELPANRHALVKWAHRESALRDIHSLPEVLDAIDEAGPARTDELLLALIRLAQAGQQLAGRTVLQAMLPKLKLMCWRTSGSTSDDWELHDRRQVGIVEFWDVMMSYPVHRRPHKVAANLALDTLHRLTSASRGGGFEEVVFDPHRIDLDEVMAAQQQIEHPHFQDPTAAAADVADADELSPDADLLEVMAWALEVRAIDSRDAALLVRVYAPSTGEPGGAGPVADELGLTPEAVRQRCSRARRALVEAAREYANTSLSLTEMCSPKDGAAAWDSTKATAPIGALRNANPSNPSTGRFT